MKHFLLFSTAAILLFFSRPAFSITVAKSGGDYATIQQGLNAANAGDTVYVKAGTYTENISFSRNGTANTPLVLRNFGSDTVVIDGQGNTATILTISDKSFVQVIGMELQNASGGDPSIGISIEGAGSDILIKNCKVHDITSDAKNAHGIAAYGTNAATPIRNLVLDGNDVYNCKLGQSESVVLNGNVDSFTVVNNVVHDNDNIGIDFIGFEGTASSNDQARNGLCAANRVYNISSASNPTYGGERSADGIYVDGGMGIVIERNTVDNCDIGIEVASEHGGKTTSSITVRSNFVSRSNQGDIMTGGYDATRGNASNISIVNNTLYHAAGGEIILQFNNNGVTIKNNICFSLPGNEYISASGSNTTNVILDNNLFYGASSVSPGSWSDAHAMFVDPQLAGPHADMHLKGTSGAINAGASLTNDIAGTLDIDGQPRVNGTQIDIGADETGFNAIVNPKRSFASGRYAGCRYVKKVMVSNRFHNNMSTSVSISGPKNDHYLLNGRSIKKAFKR